MAGQSMRLSWSEYCEGGGRVMHSCDSTLKRICMVCFRRRMHAVTPTMIDQSNDGIQRMRLGRRLSLRLSSCSGNSMVFGSIGSQLGH